MFKKIILSSICLFQMTACFAASQMKVSAISEFKTEKPTDHVAVKVLEDTALGRYNVEANSILYCQVLEIIDPKRGKRNATFFVKPLAFSTNNCTTTIEEEMYGKYSNFVLSKEELKKLPSFDMMKKAALMVGNHVFFRGLSTAYSFAEGVVKNEEDNRLKSGVINAYEESSLSYIEKGEQLDIKAGDEFYLIFKTEEDVDEPNYTYTPAEASS